MLTEGPWTPSPRRPSLAMPPRRMLHRQTVRHSIEMISLRVLPNQPSTMAQAFPTIPVSQVEAKLSSKTQILTQILIAPKTGSSLTTLVAQPRTLWMTTVEVSEVYFPQYGTYLVATTSKEKGGLFRSWLIGLHRITSFLSFKLYKCLYRLKTSAMETSNCCCISSICSNVGSSHFR